MKSTKLHLLQTAAVLAAVILLTVQADQLFPDSAEEDVCTGESCDASKQSQRGGSAAKGKGKGKGRGKEKETDSEDVNDEPTYFKNIGYLTAGYDLIKGNPHSTRDFDPGYKGSTLFKLSYDQGLVTPDGQHYVPDHCSARNQPSCSFTFTSSTVTGTGSYFDSLSVDASISGGGWGASFSASVGYKEVHEATSSHEDRIYSSKAECKVYSASINYGSAELNEDFRESVFRLGTDIDDNDQRLEYEAFIDQYGTHFVSSMRMGGRYGYRSVISSTSSMELTVEGLDVKAAAGYSGLVSVSAEAATDIQKEQAEKFNAARSQVDEFFVGGGPPSGNDSWTAKEWALTVAEDPLPITYTLVHIENLFTPDYFPEDKQIDEKRKALKEVLIMYCRKTSLEPGLCESEYHDSSSLIPIKVLKQGDVYKYLDFFVPSLLPNEFAPGIMRGKTHPNTSFVILLHGNSNVSELADLVQPAAEWMNSTNTTNKMPVCPEGFFSISDFFPTSFLDNFDDFALPCFAERCVTKCNLLFNPNFAPPSATYLFENGYPALGGYFRKIGYSFYRLPSSNRPDEPIDMCLTYSCVDF